MEQSSNKNIVSSVKKNSNKIHNRKLTKIDNKHTFPFFEKLKEKTEEAVKISTEKGKEIPEKSPRFFRKFKKTSLVCLEEFVGTIKKGTQYGNTSLNLIEELAKLKELGIVSEEEFTLKKKELLDRI